MVAWTRARALLCAVAWLLAALLANGGEDGPECPAAAPEGDALGEACSDGAASAERGVSLLSAGVRRIAVAGVREEKPKGPRWRMRTGRTRAGNHGEVNGEKGPWWDQASLNVTLACGRPAFAPPKKHCPQECGFLSPDAAQGCHWSCVPAAQCLSAGAESNVADRFIQICRKCKVARCNQCVPGQDRCAVCMPGYDFNPVDGTCHSHVDTVLNALLVATGVILAVVLIWYVALLMRPTVNDANLTKALEHRRRCKLRDEGEGHMFYTLRTDLRAIPADDQPPIGGPGMMLLFNFQSTMLLWTLVAFAAWWLLGLALGSELFHLGTYNLGDAIEICRAVRWGKSMRERFRQGKLAFTVGLYVVSTVGLVVFAAAQRRRFIRADAQSSTMMDYAVWLSGLPRERGASVEVELETFIAEATGRRPVGVSVCWDFGEDHEEIYRLAAAEVRRREAKLEGEEGSLPAVSREPAAPSREPRFAFRAWLCPRRLCCACRPICTSVDSLLAMAWGGASLAGEGDDEDESAEADRGAAEALLPKIESAGQAFAVFTSERDRNEALARLADPSVPLYKGSHVVAAQAHSYDPEDIVWENLTVTTLDVVKRTALGVLVTLLVIMLWACAYFPFALYEATNYAPLGLLPGLLFDATFMLVVVTGNQIMYLLCSIIAEKVGFFSKDTAQAAYVVLYTAAVFVNTVVDLFILVYTTYLLMVWQKVRTDEGVLLNDLPDNAALAASYPMMKFLGRKLYRYNFPSCFLTPFIGEAVFTTVVPYHLAIRIVASRAVGRQDAEACLQPMQMDLCRYGDIVVNVILVTMCFFTTSGWVLWTLGGLLVGNVFVYAFDHYRVLREVETCYFARGSVDIVAQRLLVIPCGILAAAVMFQLHGVNALGLQRYNIWLGVCGVFVLHTILHYLALCFIVPRLGKVDKQASKTPYSVAATHFPANWFTVNPVHCLRSQYIHEHDPPCILFVKGKEAVLEKNEDIGLFYHHATWANTGLTSRAAGTFRFLKTMRTRRLEAQAERLEDPG